MQTFIVTRIIIRFIGLLMILGGLLGILILLPLALTASNALAQTKEYFQGADRLGSQIGLYFSMFYAPALILVTGICLQLLSTPLATRLVR